MALLSVDELCAAIATFCSEEVAAAHAGGCGNDEATLLEQSARELLAFSRKLKDVTKAQAQRGDPSGKAGPPFANGAGKTAPHGENALPALARWADRAPERGRLCSWLGIAIGVVSLTLPYYVCVKYTSWFIDEGFAITRNPDARGETPVREVLQHDFWGTHLNPPEGYTTHKSYRPLLTLSYALEWQLCRHYGWAGREMQPMRLLSCLVHSMNAVAVLWLLRHLKLPRLWAAAGAALFATHPVHIENIVYLVGRADQMATLFSLFAILFYLKRTCGPKPALSVWGYTLLAVLTVIAGLHKEPGFTVLFFLACAEVVLRCRFRHIFGLLLCFGVIGGLRTWFTGGPDAGFGYVDTPIRYQDHLLTRTLSYLYQHAYYCKILVLPWHQSWDYSYDALPMVHSFADLRVLAIVTAYLAIAALAANGLRFCMRRPAIILGLGLVVIPFIPCCNLFFLTGTTIGERLLYPCTVGWSVLVATCGSHLAAAARRQRSILHVIFGAMVCGLLSVYVWNSNIRMGHWHGPGELFETDALHWMRSVKVAHSKASELQSRGDLPGALSYYQLSLDIFDDQAITDYCIARILINLGRYQEALARFEKILAGHGIGLHDGNDFLWMTDLGYVLVQLGSFENGVHYLNEGLQRMPYNCYAWNALGVAQIRLQQLEQSLQSFTQGLQCDPDSVSMWSNVAVLYAYGSNPQQAREALERAVALDATRPAVAQNVRVLQGMATPGEQPQLDLYIPYPGRR